MKKELDFDSELLKLLSELKEKQYRTKTGKLLENDVIQFVKIIKILIKYVDDDISALLNADVETRWYYYNNGSQEYISPHTQIYYSNNNFHLTRKKEEFKKWDNRKHKNKLVFFSFKCTKKCHIGNLLKELTTLISLSNFSILETTDSYVKFAILL